MAMLMLLRTRERWTAAQLASELEVSVRTVYRDVDALQQSGVPLWTEAGPSGGVRLLPGWRNDLDALSADEAAALHLAAVPDAAAELGLGMLATNAQLKVRTTLPPELRARAARIAERFHLDAPGWFHHPDDVTALPTIAHAVWSERRLDLRYARSGREVDRRVDPLGLVLKAGVWYLVAAHRGRISTYRVGRVRRAAVRDERARRPEGFDLAAWWTASAEEFDRSLLRARCTIELDRPTLRRLASVTDRAAVERAAEAAVECDDHRLRIELECESHRVLATQLLSLDGEWTVMAPPELRALLADLSRRVHERHAH